jgi:hypothetical protein
LRILDDRSSLVAQHLANPILSDGLADFVSILASIARKVGAVPRIALGDQRDACQPSWHRSLLLLSIGPKA